jgi:hypothetical protein
MKHHYVYVLEIRVNGKLIRQVDIFESYKCAEEAAKEISLEPNETTNIAVVEYDAYMNKLAKLY